MTAVMEPAVSGAQLLDAFVVQKQKVSQINAELAEARKRHPGWAPLAGKEELWQLEDRLDEAKREAGRLTGDALAVLFEGLAEPEYRAACREVLADYFVARLRHAEDERDDEAVARFRAVIGGLDDAPRVLPGREIGTLSLRSNVPAEATLWQYEARGFGLHPVGPRSLGRTPIGSVELEAGSYLVELSSAGHRTVRYPVRIDRGRHWDGVVRLYTNDEIGAGFRYIPGGPFLQGGDPQTCGWALPLTEHHLDDYFLAEHPVLSGEYLEFLNDLVRTDPDAARRHAPRLYPDRGPYWPQDPDGAFRLPAAGRDGREWHPRQPVVAVSWHDAMAYCAWRSARDGRQYRLPTEHQWEKAGRGVDGRWYPWGNRFDPSLCNMRDSHRDGPGPVSVDEFPTDVSVYGLRGMAGNVRDWTATAVDEYMGDVELPDISYTRWQRAHRAKVLRGGAWSPLVPRLADRYWLAGDLVLSFVGFRLACDPTTS